MNRIVACGNCHTPEGPNGKAIESKELAGGDPIDAPVFHAVPSNISPDNKNISNADLNDLIAYSATPEAGHIEIASARFPPRHRRGNAGGGVAVSSPEGTLRGGEACWLKPKKTTRCVPG
jgi:hypothetical protein